MKAWIQSSDLSAREFDADLNQALREFDSHDWSQEDALHRRLESEGKEHCPAGIGLVREDGQILHICPGGNAAMVHWHRRTRVLGLLWNRVGITTVEGVALQKVRDLIENFYGFRDNALASVIDSAGAA